jgi:AraC-like DNA-binding protein
MEHPTTSARLGARLRAMPEIRVTSTADVDPARRHEYWQEGARTIGGMHTWSASPDRFDAHAKVVLLENLKFGQVVVSPNEACWTRDLMRITDDSFFRLVLQRRGTAEIEQGDTRFILRPGEWTLLAASRPHTIRCSEPVEELVVIVPGSSVVARIREFSERLAGSHPADSGVGRVFFQFVHSILEYLGTTSSAVDDHLDAAGAALIRALLESTLGERVRPSRRELRIEEARVYISEHLCDPGLSVQQVAEAMGVSKRYVHSLFAGRQSVHSLIWESRLQRCARDLARAEMLGTSIVKIALSYGFGCSAHFSRLFKAHYGVAPREYRNRAH